MKYKKVHEEVLRATGPVATLMEHDIQTLKKLANQTNRKRLRICIHRHDNEIVQEMFIVHTKHTYIRPHKHLFKNESLYLVEGSADILLFNEKGNVKKIIPMGDYRSGKQFYMKSEKPTYHSMIIRSPYLVFLEITNGPFRKNETMFAPWSPEETDSKAVTQFKQELERKIKDITKLSRSKKHD